MEELGFRRIHVLRRDIGSERPAAEGDDPAARIGDREHDPVAEPVIGHGNVGAVANQPAAFDLVPADTL